MSLLRLPHDILICVLLYLDIPTVFKCQRVCKQLKEAADSEYLHKSFCHRAGWLKKHETIDHHRIPIASNIHDTSTFPIQYGSDGDKYSALRIGGRKDDDVASYKAYVASSWKLDFTKYNADFSFAGGTNHYPEDAPKSIKIDHIDDVMVVATSGPPGGLHFVDMNTGAALNTECGPCLASGGVELDHGWLAYLKSFDVMQISCFERCSSVDKPRRGHLVDCGQIKLKHLHARHRMHFPYLLVGSDAGFATLYDVTTQECVLQVALENQPARLSISYVEFDLHFIFVVLATGYPFGTVQAYCLQTGRFLHELSHTSQTIRHARAWRFMPECDDEGNVKCPGWGLQQVESIEEYFSTGDLSLWGVAQPDHKTGSLVLLWGTFIVIVPHYVELFNRDEKEDLADPVASKFRATILADSSYEPEWDLPAWARQRRHSPRPCLSVSDGRAAISAKNGVAVIDLAGFAGILPSFEDSHHLRSDPGSSDKVVVYGAPHIFKAYMHGLTSLALTPTCLAWVGSFVCTEPHPVSARFRDQCGVEQVYCGENFSSVFWIDFGKLKDKHPDPKRQKEETRRLQCLETCKKELDRRIAANKSGKYVLRTGREIADIGEHYKDPLAMVELLLSLGEFSDESLWVDWETTKRDKGGKAVAKRVKSRRKRPQTRARVLTKPRLHRLVDEDSEASSEQSSEGEEESVPTFGLTPEALRCLLNMGAGGSFSFTLPDELISPLFGNGPEAAAAWRTFRTRTTVSWPTRKRARI